MSVHQVTPEEITELETLGFQIDKENLIPENFINHNFPGFDVLEFAREMKNYLQPIAEVPIQKKLTLIDGILPKLVIFINTNNIFEPDHRLIFKRSFIKDNDVITVKHDFLALPLAARGKRLGRKLLKTCLNYYLAVGVSKVNVHAAMEDGGYEWTKAGFRATDPEEMAKILIDSRQMLNGSQFALVEALYKAYYNNNPYGNAFPIIEWSGLPFMKAILKRNDWHGELDLTNSEDLLNFNEYVNG